MKRRCSDGRVASIRTKNARPGQVKASSLPYAMQMRSKTGRKSRGIKPSSKPNLRPTNDNATGDRDGGEGLTAARKNFLARGSEILGTLWDKAERAGRLDVIREGYIRHDRCSSSLWCGGRTATQPTDTKGDERPSAEGFAAGSGRTGGEGTAARTRAHDNVLVLGQQRCSVISRCGRRRWIVGHCDRRALSRRVKSGIHCGVPGCDPLESTYLSSVGAQTTHVSPLSSAPLIAGLQGFSRIAQYPSYERRPPMLRALVAYDMFSFMGDQDGIYRANCMVDRAHLRSSGFILATGFS
jgi:hypothetical protein